MVVGEASINNIMGGIENTGTVRLHNHKRKLKQRFDIIKKLGQGTYGKVQLGINKETGQEVAIKTIKKSKIETEADLIRIRREIQIMSSVQHPNIIHIYEVFENREKMVLVMEYAAGGELYDYLSERKVLVEEEARRIFRQISTACYYCHKHKICHRDLKLENILLDENRNAKIADFGLSNVFDDQRLLSTFCGSPLYASPEIVKGTPYHGPEVDCWSLGVLLYTLVYGAMPFDGSNFKRLVKQISQGDYFEPKNPSPASPLIQEMLTVNPKNRASIEKICAHWWVNEGYDESCLEISEDLANQTPVRLDVLLSLNPPPSQLEGDKLVVTGTVPEEEMKAEPVIPTRSQSVGSLMDISNPAERRIKDLIAQELQGTPKRKLETTVSTDQANINLDGKRKEKIVKEHTVADISVNSNHLKQEQDQDVKMRDVTPAENTNIKNEIEEKEMVDPSLQGAACAEILEEAKKIEAKKPPKLKKTLTTSLSTKILEEINENPSQENLHTTTNGTNAVANKENVEATPLQTQEDSKPEIKDDKGELKTPKKKIIKKKVLTDKNETAKPKVVDADKKDKLVEQKSEEVAAEPPLKPVERRQSRIFEQAEKFQNMITSSDAQKAQPPEKPKKIVIPGVCVGGFKKEFERKASLTNVSPPKLRNTTSKKHIIEDKQNSVDVEPETTPAPEQPVVKSAPVKTEEPKLEAAPKPSTKVENSVKETPIAAPVDDERKAMMKNAVSIISNALDKEGARKSKSRPCMGRKPPVPFGASGRSASGSIAIISPMSPPPDGKRLIKMQSAPVDNRPVLISSTPEQVKSQPEPVQPENQTSSAEITLKSATLPRRKSTKAEIQLDYPKPKPASMEFKTEMAHKVQAPPTLTTQRSEVLLPVNSPPHSSGLRSSSVEPESRLTRKERIIPIAFERHAAEKDREPIQSPPSRPPVPRPFTSQRSTVSQRSNSLSRQSTQESDSETTISGDPIKKSPREYIIPIAVEGGGYVTPRANSLEPSETSSTVTNSSKKTASSKFGRPRRMMSFFDRDGSEDESPFNTLHRHSSFGKDSDTEGDSRKDAFHRLRSSRPRRSNLEHNDSLSSGEDDDDDDGFEFLTAENLFSTLLSRVRDLTQRINVDDGSRPGFPNSRLLSHFDRGTNFWNRMEPLSSSRHSPLGRQFSRDRNPSSSSSIPWRRSVSRDLATDIDSVFNDRTTPTQTATLPRRDKTDRKENLNLSDLNLKKLKLTEEDALALSYLTPGLSRRIQKQLFASLPPSEARKISRTMSMRNENEPERETTIQRRSVDRISSTLPRKFSFDKQQNIACDINQNNAYEENHTKTNNNVKSFLPKKSSSRDITSPYTDRSESLDSRKSDYSTEVTKPRSRFLRGTSLREPSDYKSKLHTYSLRSPDSSISEMSSLKDDTSYGCGPETTSLSKYLHSSTLLDNCVAENKPETKPVRKVSRFLRPDFYDTPKEESAVVKEKKEREMETQKVLKEIRDKRIKNRISLRRERSLSREAEAKKDETVCNGKQCSESDLNKSSKIRKKIVRKDVDEKVKDSGDNIIKCKELVAALTSNESKLGFESNSNTEKLLKNVSDNIKNIESNVMLNAQQKDVLQTEISIVQQQKDSAFIPIQKDVVSTQQKDVTSTLQKDATSRLQKDIPPKDVIGAQSKDKKERISKLIRPKSYPAENGATKDTSDKPTKVSETKKASKLKKSDSPTKVKDPEKVSTKNKFLQSIEKKFEKLRTFNSDSKSSEPKDDKKSGVETTIKRLREQSVPRNVDHITESTLIKRAVSVEDFSNVKTKLLQPSRKSVTKILSLFKKYEDKEKSKEEESQLNKNGADPVMLGNINESNIPMFKSKIAAAATVRDTKSPEITSEIERPKSLLVDKVKKYNGSKSDNALATKASSRLPVNSVRKSLNMETSKSPTEEITNNNNNNNNIVNGSSSSEAKLADRNHLKLDFTNINEPTDDVNLNRISYTTDESSTLLSPCDETISCDSWSVCSDFHHTQDLLSPVSPNGNVYNSGDENESVIDRIRRKSFYTRFNEKKKPRKSLVGNYKDLDLYKDYNQKPVQRYTKTANDYTGSLYRRNSGYSSSGETEPDYRRYSRSKSLMNDYVNVPNRYQTYNPKRSNVASLYSSEESPMDDGASTGTYRKYSYYPNTSRLSSLSRSSRSPSSDIPYTPHAHTSASEHSSISSPTENGRPVTEHAV